VAIDDIYHANLLQHLQATTTHRHTDRQWFNDHFPGDVQAVNSSSPKSHQYRMFVQPDVHPYANQRNHWYDLILSSTTTV